MIEQQSINAIQVLRAYAAASVMIGHGISEYLAAFNEGQVPNLFYLLAGVDIFFVISGFIMYYTTKNLFGVPGGSQIFWRRRIIRIVPLYWLFTTLMVFSLLFAGSAVNSTKFDLWNVVSSYLFIPTERPGGKLVPVLSVGWTLNYEMFFYALFGLCMFLRRRAGVLVLTALLLGLVVLGRTTQIDLAALRFWAGTIVLEFAFGVWLGVMYERQSTRSDVLAMLLVLAGLGMLLIMNDWDVSRFIKGGIPATTIVAGALLLQPETDRRIPGWLLLIGASSYALYLSHRFVLRGLTVFFEKAHLHRFLGEASIVLYVVTALALAIIVSVLVYRYLERPVTRWLSRRFGSVSAQAPLPRTA